MREPLICQLQDELGATTLDIFLDDFDRSIDREIVSYDEVVDSLAEIKSILSRGMASASLTSRVITNFTASRLSIRRRQSWNMHYS